VVVRLVVHTLCAPTSDATGNAAQLRTMWHRRGLQVGGVAVVSTLRCWAKVQETWQQAVPAHGTTLLISWWHHWCKHGLASG
jgi:hypothetical protein